MAESIWVDPHADYAGRDKIPAKGTWSPRKKLVYFLIYAALAWSLVLTPFLFIG